MIFRSAQLITVVLLLVAVADLPYDYYTLLRFVVCPVSAFGAYKANAVISHEELPLAMHKNLPKDDA